MPVEQPDVARNDLGESVLAIDEHGHRFAAGHHQAELAVRMDHIGEGAKQAV